MRHRGIAKFTRYLSIFVTFFLSEISQGESLTMTTDSGLEKAQIETVKSFRAYYTEISRPKPNLDRVQKAKSALFQAAAKTDEHLGRQREEWFKSFEGKTFDENGEYARVDFKSDKEMVAAKSGEAEAALDKFAKNNGDEGTGVSESIKRVRVEERKKVMELEAKENLKNISLRQTTSSGGSSYSKSEAQPGIADQEIIYDEPAPKPVKKSKD